MKVWRMLLVLASVAAMAMFVFASQAAAHDDPLHPDDPTHPGSCWDVTKVAKDSHGNVITSLTLSVGQTFTIFYEIVVTERDCLPHETPHDSIRVEDTFFDEPLAIHLDHSETFRYTRDITAHECGEFDVHNTATIFNDVEIDSSSVTVHVTVPCDHGCTLTQGYWKTHADPSTKKFDTTWNLLPGGLGPNTTFFLSGQTWIQVFNTSPSGNAYYQLAHQYMAAVLNMLNGASSTPAVDAAITSATTLFNTYTPAQIGALKGNDPVRQQFISLAGTLGSYNEGAIGPGHCDE